MSSSEGSKKKEKKTYTEEDLKKALNDIREQKKSIRQICKEYAIPKTTLLDKISGRRPDGVNKPGPALGVDSEKKVVEWLLNISKCGFPVKKQELLDTVQKIIRDGELENKFKDDRPGQKWFVKFLARNKEVSLKNAEGINKGRAQVTEESIRLWFTELEEYLDSIHQKDILNDPKRIFNGDESGFALCPKTGKVLGPRGFKNLYQIKPSNEKDNLTVLLTFNANGDMCPPCVVFPYIRPPKAVVNSMPQEWCLGRSETGWMRGEVFFEYVTNEFHNWVVENNIIKPILLLVDGHKSHMSLMLSTSCEELQIILYALPPNTTHILQPADVSVFAPVKTYWKSTVRAFLSKPENLNSAVTKTNFCTLLNGALHHPNMADNIKNGFKRCGLYPFDANSPDYTKCVRNTLENVQAVDQQSQDITHSDIKIFKKVLKHLKPTLKEKNINIRTITRAVNSFKNTLPAEVGFAEISIETESERSLMELSIEQNSTILELDATKEITISSLHVEDENINDEANSDSTVQVQTVTAEIHSAPKPSTNAEPCTSKITSNRNLASSKIDYDEITLYPDNSKTLDTNKNNSFPDLSLSTLHLSGLDVDSIVSLDDVLILPLEDIILSTPTSTTSSVEKETPTKEQTPELPLTSLIHAVSIVSPSFVLPTENSPLVQPYSAAVGDSSQKKTCDPFKNHLMLPEISKEARKPNKQRTPAAISSAAWRKYYEDKEQIKNEKQEAIRKRKLERIEKKEQEEARKVQKIAPKRKKKIKVTQETIESIDVESEKENVPAVELMKCAECDDVLISDVEDDDEKNIGCDKCIRWYHLKCTRFLGLSYSEAKDNSFECDLCD